MTKLQELSANHSFGGEQLQVRHRSAVCDCDMTFSLYLPPQAKAGPVPLVTWLSGLTCTDRNFVEKAGAQAHAAAHGLAILAPDTSPRGDDVADDPDGAYDFGLGAGFYVNATEAPFAAHYRMYDYAVDELPGIIAAAFPVDLKRQSIFGHSMGGHGALTIALRNPGRFKSVSAFAPISSPMNCPWGTKALSGYLGDDRESWKAHDTVALIAEARERLPLLIDQGLADDFLDEQLKPDLLKKACEEYGHPLTLRLQPDYDHSYFFIATFMADHIAHHARAVAG